MDKITVVCHKDHDKGYEDYVGKCLLCEVERARLDEREACAKVCDGIMQYYKTNTTMNTDQNLIGYIAAELCGVRIRGKHE